MGSSKNNYSAADIERYHSGKMSGAEMHALEKAALDDPFLADALEGYTYSKNPSAEIASLKEKLSNKRTEKNTVPFLFRNHNWMKAAAAVLVVAASAWLLIRNSSNQQAGQANIEAYAKTRDSSKIADALTRVTTPGADSVSDGNVVMNTSRPPASERSSAFENHKKNEPSVQAPSVQRMKQKELNARSEEIKAKEKAETTQAELASQASVALMDSAPASDMAGRKTMATQVPNDSVKDLNIVMKPLNQPVSEVVINKNAAPRSASKDQSQLDGYIKIDTLEPSGGWVKFDDYIASNIKRPEELKEKNISGEVLLSFDVDVNGIPQNIRVEKSLCASCDEEAIRLLKEGPKWEKKKNKKGKVKIKF